MKLKNKIWFIIILVTIILSSVTITAEWISNGDEIDTTIGYTPLNITIPVTVVVEQDT